MTVGEGKPAAALGFVTVVEDAQHGLFGGYLLLNLAGRPLEFHCTAPIKASRAQEILYGRTLKPFLYGEQIGQTLITRAKQRPLVVCTDVEPMMALRDSIQLPVLLVASGDDPASGGERDRQLRVDGQHPSLAGLHTFKLGDQQLALRAADAADRQRVEQFLKPLGEGFDLAEPFGRIRAAIEEAGRAAR